VKQNDLEDAREIALLIEAGVATKRDVLSLLMYVRDEVSIGMIKDLAHFVAHPTRDRGYTFDRIEAFVAKMVKLVHQGGMLNVQPIFDAKSLIKGLSKELEDLDIPLKRSTTYRNRQQLFNVLEELLDGDSIALKDPNVDTCVFKRLIPDNPDSFLFRRRIQSTAKGKHRCSGGSRRRFPAVHSARISVNRIVYED
jgi:hypothetical protein